MQLFVIRSAQMRKGSTISLDLELGSSSITLDNLLADPLNIEEEYMD